jgi:hypothetical protein
LRKSLFQAGVATDCGDQEPLEPIDEALSGLLAMAAPTQDGGVPIGLTRRVTVRTSEAKFRYRHSTIRLSTDTASPHRTTTEPPLAR